MGGVQTLERRTTRVDLPRTVPVPGPRRGWWLLGLWLVPTLASKLAGELATERLAWAMPMIAALWATVFFRANRADRVITFVDADGPWIRRGRWAVPIEELAIEPAPVPGLTRRRLVVDGARLGCRDPERTAAALDPLGLRTVRRPSPAGLLDLVVAERDAVRRMRFLGAAGMALRVEGRLHDARRVLGASDLLLGGAIVAGGATAIAASLPGAGLLCLALGIAGWWLWLCRPIVWTDDAGSWCAQGRGRGRAARSVTMEPCAHRVFLPSRLRVDGRLVLG